MNLHRVLPAISCTSHLPPFRNWLLTLTHTHPHTLLLLTLFPDAFHGSTALHVYSRPHPHAPRTTPGSSSRPRAPGSPPSSSWAWAPPRSSPWASSLPPSPATSTCTCTRTTPSSPASPSPTTSRPPSQPVPQRLPGGAPHQPAPRALERPQRLARLLPDPGQQSAHPTQDGCVILLMCWRPLCAVHCGFALIIARVPARHWDAARSVRVPLRHPRSRHTVAPPLPPCAMRTVVWDATLPPTDNSVLSTADPNSAPARRHHHPRPGHRLLVPQPGTAAELLRAHPGAGEA